MISQPYLAFLGICSVATIFFSLFNAPRIRGFRNLGFLTIYIGTLVSFFFVGWKAVLFAWAIFGILSGAIYYAYELYSTAKSREEKKEWPKPIAIIHGLLMWPIMLPEATEYLLADLGILKAPEQSESQSSGAQDETDV